MNPTSSPLVGRLGAQGPEAASQHALSGQQASTRVPTPAALPRQPGRLFSWSRARLSLQGLPVT